MKLEESINQLIKSSDADTNLISDGYHSFKELYEHRIHLFIALCNVIENHCDFTDLPTVWRSKLHSDGSLYPGWFILGIGQNQGEQITYHIPEKYWGEIECRHTLDRAPEFDGHTSQDVLNKLMEIY